MEGFKTLHCFSKFPWARGSISSKFIGNLIMGSQKVRQPWHRLRELNKAAKERRQQKAVENCILGSFVLCTLHWLLFGK